MSKKNICEIFGSNVFNDSVMRERLPEDTYAALKSAIKEGKGIDRSIANTVASAMKDGQSKRALPILLIGSNP